MANASLTHVTFVHVDLRGSDSEPAVPESTGLRPALLCNTVMPDIELEPSHSD